MVITWRALHHRMLLDHTELSKSTRWYQRSQEVLLHSKERMRCLCMLTLGQHREGKEEKVSRERSKKARDKESPVMERVLMLFLNHRS